MGHRVQVSLSAKVLLGLTVLCLQLHHHHLHHLRLQLRQLLLRVLLHRQDLLRHLVLGDAQDSWGYQGQGMKDMKVEPGQVVVDIQLPGNSHQKNLDSQRVVRNLADFDYLGLNQVGRESNHRLVYWVSPLVMGKDSMGMMDFPVLMVTDSLDLAEQVCWVLEEDMLVQLVDLACRICSVFLVEMDTQVAMEYLFQFDLDIPETER